MIATRNVVAKYQKMYKGGKKYCAKTVKIALTNWKLIWIKFIRMTKDKNIITILKQKKVNGYYKSEKRNR